MPEVSESNEETISGINITPLVDVCLVLVLIFMVTSSLITKELIPVSVPEAITSRAESEENITVSVSPTDGFAINEKRISKKGLSAELKKQMKATGVDYILIRADERTPHGEVEDLMKISKKLGAGRIAFATVPKSQ